MPSFLGLAITPMIFIFPPRASVGSVVWVQFAVLSSICSLNSHYIKLEQKYRDGGARSYLADEGSGEKPVAAGITRSQRTNSKTLFSIPDGPPETAGLRMVTKESGVRRGRR